MIASFLVLLLGHRSSSNRRTISASPYPARGSGAETGLLIQTSLGRAGGWGALRTKRSRVTLVSKIEHILTLPQDALRLAIVNRGWRPLWLPLHCAAAAKPPEERATPREFPFVSDLFFLALLLIN